MLLFVDSMGDGIVMIQLRIFWYQQSAIIFSEGIFAVVQKLGEGFQN